MENIISLEHVKEKYIYDLKDDFTGKSISGDEISFTNYYMKINNRPFFGVSGECHFSRMSEARWEDEIIKMKMAGINIISTYVFWNHHEEEEGIFDFSGCRNLRSFVELCKKHGLYVILRVGPFDHGEVRNGGIPDWLYGKPFEVRKLSEGFLYYTRRLYTKIGEQVSGLFFKDGGPVIGVQIDNEYMHSSAPWELTTGISDEWVFGGDEGENYMLRLKELAAECGLVPAFYTCTGWGGAAVPDSMMPLWGGYAFRPWLFYSYKGEHPATEEYVYQDFHNNHVVCTNDFKPSYQPETRPYACCEMGGGMMCSYYYRFRYDYKSVDAMSNIKIASGCNFLGYYMFHGGSNPVGKHGLFLNEGQVPKISYDYQAALGEFGQVRESYRRLKNLHFFVKMFAERLCSLQTVLPDGASEIKPKDRETLRYAVRTDGKRGFLFVNNYQDHAQMEDKRDACVVLQLKNETITFQFDLAKEENVIMPFHFDMEGIDLVKVTAQPITRIEDNGKFTYVFFTPAGMKAAFEFEEGVLINGDKQNLYTCREENRAELITVAKGDTEIKILVLDRTLADQLYLLEDRFLVFTENALLEDETGIRMETRLAENIVMTYPKDIFGKSTAECEDPELNELFGIYKFNADEKKIPVNVKKVSDHRYTLSFPDHLMEGLKDALLQLDYTGDIGHAFIEGKLISDNFANGDTWEIGLKGFETELANHEMTIYITPLREGVNVNVESAMAARLEEADVYTGKLKNANIQPIYEIYLR